MISRLDSEYIKMQLQQLGGPGVQAPDDEIDLDEAMALIDRVTAPDELADHVGVCAELTELYQRKNKDYGGSFTRGWQKYGPVMALIRLEDKLNRAGSLIKNGGAAVNEESLRDTLVDLANYAIMSVMELDREVQDGDA